MRVVLHWKSGRTTETEVPEPPAQAMPVPAALERLSESPWAGRDGRPLSSEVRTFVLVRRVVAGEMVCEYHERP